MSKLEKRLRALAAGKDLPWDKIVVILEHYGVTVQPPRGGGSHFKVFVEGREPLTVPVHSGKVKKIYAQKISEFLKEFIEVE